MIVSKSLRAREFKQQGGIVLLMGGMEVCAESAGCGEKAEISRCARNDKIIS
jgi:hypothetical protein